MIPIKSILYRGYIIQFVVMYMTYKIKVFPVNTDKSIETSYYDESTKKVKDYAKSIVDSKIDKFPVYNDLYFGERFYAKIHTKKLFRYIKTDVGPVNDVTGLCTQEISAYTKIYLMVT